MSVETTKNHNLNRRTQDADSWADSVIDEIKGQDIWADQDLVSVGAPEADDQLIAERGNLGSFVGGVLGKLIEVDEDIADVEEVKK